MTFPANLELSALTGTDGFRINGEAAGDNSGADVAGAGDINGDGFEDLITGGWRADPNGLDSGASHVVFGKASSFTAEFELSSLTTSNGFQINGEAAGDHCNLSVAGTGDVNGDGFGDLIVGARSADPNGDGSGASYVVFGKASGFAANLELSSLTGTNGFQINGETGYDSCGVSVAGAGDVNGDGFDDMIVGASSADPDGSDSGSGASYVIFGKAAGFAANFELTSLTGTNGFQINGEVAGDSNGRSVAGAGDINGDGFDDLIIGALSADPNGSESGASYVVFGKASGFAGNLELTALDGADGFQINGVAASDSSGWPVASAGDVNGDGFADLIIGARDADPNGSESGASYVVFGKASGFAANLELSALNGTTGFRVNGEVANDRSGCSVAGAGDVNGDGFDDVIVGAFYAEPKGEKGGAAYVVFGKETGFAATFDLSALDGSDGFQIDSEEQNYHTGYSVASAGDVNGDGLDDLYVGAPRADPNGNYSGASYVIFGRGPDSSVNRTGTVASQTLVGSDQRDTLSGLGGDDRLIGNGGNDILNGGTGADTLTGAAGSDTLNGGASADNMNGGTGDDLYIVDNLGDIVSEAGGGGIDRVHASISFKLGAGLENLMLTGIGNIDGTGNGSNNFIVGTQGKNTLKGNAGNDTLKGIGESDRLFGGGDHDLLFGGNQADRLYGASGRDTLRGEAGVDKLFGGAGNDQLIGGSQGDKLFGGAGKDTLKGGAGNDQLHGDAGNDWIIGGGGSDTAVYSGSIGRYDIVKAGNKIKVIDTTGKLGTDTLSSVEKLKFGGKVFSVKKALKLSGPDRAAPKSATDDNAGADDDPPSQGESGGLDVTDFQFETLLSGTDDLLV